MGKRKIKIKADIMRRIFKNKFFNLILKGKA